MLSSTLYAISSGWMLRSACNGSEVINETRASIALPKSVQNFVISSSDRPFVSGISQPTSMTVNKAPALKNQKVPFVAVVSRKSC
jgi:hypothetical protein